MVINMMQWNPMKPVLHVVRHVISMRLPIMYLKWTGLVETVYVRYAGLKSRLLMKVVASLNVVTNL